MHYDVQANTRSLYIHWPFCPYKCHYCPFVAIAGHDQFMHDYHKSLMAEIETFAHQVPQKLSLDTIYLGGGTPSTWPNELLLDMSGRLRSMFCMDSISEITIEANPGTVEPGKLEVWKEAGITRISIGVQSLDDAVLANLNRHQKASDVYKLIHTAAPLFNNLSIDLIIGLPGVSQEAWKKMVIEICQWPITHVSLYFLSIHEETPLYFRIKKKEITIIPDDEMVDLYYWSVETLQKYGLMQYEISSFARAGFESKHNQVYWDRKPYKGFGMGACSFDGKARFQNEKNLSKYLINALKGQDLTIAGDQLTQEEVRLEKLMLGLRRKNGVVMSEIINELSEEKQAIFKERVSDLEKGSLVRCDGDTLYLMPHALAVENEIAVTLSV